MQCSNLLRWFSSFSLRRRVSPRQPHQIQTQNRLLLRSVTQQTSKGIRGTLRNPLLSLLILLLIPLILHLQTKKGLTNDTTGIPAIGAFDDYPMWIEYVYFTGKTPYTTYKLKLREPNFQLKGRSNECGIIKFTLPNNFPTIQEPLDDHPVWFTLKWAGGEKWLYYGNKDYNKNNSIKPKEMNCEMKSKLTNEWGWTWASSASKSTVWVWWSDYGGSPVNADLVVILYDPPTKEYILTSKSDACGIVKFKYAWQGVQFKSSRVPYKNIPIIDYNKPFTLMTQSGAEISTNSWNSMNWYPTPFCKQGKAFGTLNRNYEWTQTGD